MNIRKIVARFVQREPKHSAETVAHDHYCHCPQYPVRHHSGWHAAR